MYIEPTTQAKKTPAQNINNFENNDAVKLKTFPTKFFLLRE